MTAVGRLAEALGTADFTVRSEQITSLAQPHRFYLLQRVHDTFADFSQEKRDEVSALLGACDMAQVLTTTLDRRMIRCNNLEVWQ